MALFYYQADLMRDKRIKRLLDQKRWDELEQYYHPEVVDRMKKYYTITEQQRKDLEKAMAEEEFNINYE